MLDKNALFSLKINIIVHDFNFSQGVSGFVTKTHRWQWAFAGKAGE